MELQPALSNRRPRDDEFLEDVNLDDLDLDDLLLDEELGTYLSEHPPKGMLAGLSSATSSAPTTSSSSSSSTSSSSSSTTTTAFPFGSHQAAGLQQQQQQGFSFSYPQQQPAQSDPNSPGLIKNTIVALKGYFFPHQQAAHNQQHKQQSQHNQHNHQQLQQKHDHEAHSSPAAAAAAAAARGKEAGRMETLLSGQAGDLSSLLQKGDPFNSVFSLEHDHHFDSFVMGPDFTPDLPADGFIGSYVKEEALSTIDPGVMTLQPQRTHATHTHSHTHTSSSFTSPRFSTPDPYSLASSPPPSSPMPMGSHGSEPTKKRKFTTDDVDMPPVHTPTLSSRSLPKDQKLKANGSHELETSAETIIKGDMIATSTPEDMLRALNDSFVQQSEAAAKRKLELKRQQKIEATDDKDLEKKLKQRENHASVERKRRENINDCIHDLAKMVPDMQDMKLNKGGLLRRAVDYMEELKEHNTQLESQLNMAVSQWTSTHNKCGQLTLQLMEATNKIKELTQLNAALQAKLKNGQHGSPDPMMFLEVGQTVTSGQVSGGNHKSSTYAMRADVDLGLDLDETEEFIQQELLRKRKDIKGNA